MPSRVTHPSYPDITSRPATSTIRQHRRGRRDTSRVLIPNATIPNRRPPSVGTEGGLPLRSRGDYTREAEAAPQLSNATFPCQRNYPPQGFRGAKPRPSGAWGLHLRRSDERPAQALSAQRNHIPRGSGAKPLRGPSRLPTEEAMSAPRKRSPRNATTPRGFGGRSPAERGLGVAPPEEMTSAPRKRSPRAGDAQKRVPSVGLEPTRPFGQRFLRPSRLPVPPTRRTGWQL